MSGRTAFLSKLIGIYCILVAIPMGLNKAATLHMAAGLVNDAPVLYLFGLTIIAAGLAIVLSHNVWSSGALPVIVTLIGWVTLLKGLLFLFAPPPAAAGIAVWRGAYQQYYYLDVALALVLGVYLTYGGYASKPR